MSTVKAAPKTTPAISPEIDNHCYHCGEPCDASIQCDSHIFCCNGCSFVYELLKENGLCNYYDLSNTPGIKVKGRFRSDKFAFLDGPDVQAKIMSFHNEGQSQAKFYLPQMHCASCIWLLENLHVIHSGVLFCKTNFQRKELYIGFDHHVTTLRKIVELLAFIGYEPYISLEEAGKKEPKKINRQQFYKIGIAGFCFSNIMMLSFPEYFSSGKIAEQGLKHLFSTLNLLLALPVFFYSASGFFTSAWTGIRQKWLNIDAPIALSILITFSRSAYEVLSGTGSGYFDSMSGIVFFMLVGRWFQNKTYDALSFDRDYKSYFPLAITRVVNGEEEPSTISALKKDDQIRVRNEEMVPADALLLSETAQIDYSFVSGENTPVLKRKGEIIFAGGKQTGGSIDLLVVKPVDQSYITQLWNNNTNNGAGAKNHDRSFIHPWSRYFTLVLFMIAGTAGIYWGIVNPAKVMPAISASLIVACPCSLLLSATFTYGNMLRYFGKHHCYLKNATVIEALSKVNTIVLDKTGTITHTSSAAIRFVGTSLNGIEKRIVYSLASQSAHPLSKFVKDHLLKQGIAAPLPVKEYRETPGKGIEGSVNGIAVKLGSAAFVGGCPAQQEKTAVWIAIDNTVKGYYAITNAYLTGVPELVKDLEARNYALHVLSGDNDAEKPTLEAMFPPGTPLLFNLTPAGKQEYIAQLKRDPRNRVLTLGDGLNDAGALLQSDVGIAVTENTSQFTPASDAILDRSQVSRLQAFLGYARSGQRIVMASWLISIAYNFVGLSFAVQARLSPMVAAVLMPSSSITLVAFVTLATSLSAKSRKL